MDERVPHSLRDSRDVVWTSAIVVALIIIGIGSPASASPHRYDGLHPATDGEFCYIEAPHIHANAPLQPTVLFRKHKGHNHFVGDPIAYGYDGPAFNYHGHHRLVLGGGEFFCYLDGPHSHQHPADVHGEFEVKGDIHWYVGPLGPRYKRNLYRQKRINAVYARFDYQRPVVTVDPPAAYAGVVIEAPVAVVLDARAPLVAAAVEVSLPSFLIGFGVDVGGHAHRSHPKHRHGKYKHKVKRKHRKHKGHKRHKRNKRRNRRWRF